MVPLRPAPSPYRSSLPWRPYNGLATRLDRHFGWDKLPLPLALAVLAGVRNALRRNNLHDSELLPSTDVPPPCPTGHRTPASARWTAPTTTSRLLAWAWPARGSAGTSR